MGRLIVNVPVKQVQCDEIWGYVGKKEKSENVADFLVPPIFFKYRLAASRDSSQKNHEGR